jgi:3-phenylpropionate/cinnamic acid dioxygenase small subunit
MSVRPDLEAALYRNAQGYDTNDMELFAQSFAEHATVTLGQTVVGRDAWVEQTSGRRDQVQRDGGRPRHVITNVLIESESATEARSRAYFLFSIATAGSLAVLTTGCYHDRWVKDGDRWRIAERVIENDIAT